MSLQRSRSAFSFSAKIRSRMAEAESLCIRIRDTLQTNDLARHCFAIELLARESLSNAVNHGNGNDPARAIDFQLWAGREWIRMQVRDEGPGFAWRKALRNGRDVTTPFGRGLTIYALYAERTQFNRRGNQVTSGFER